MSFEKIKEHILYDNIDISVFDCLESTNKTAKEFAKDGAAEGGLIVAENQTKGRGRLGRSFFSPGGGGAYFSLILRPEMSGEDAVLITTAAAVAVCRAIEKLSGKKAEIKWVNDVFVSGKKVCGILTEASLKQDGRIDYAVLGIGANISPPEEGFPKDIKQIAGTVLEKSVPFGRELFIAETVNNFMPLYNDIFSLETTKEYKSRSIVLGKTVTFERDGIKKTAKVIDIDERCRLVVQSGEEKEVLSSGEVSIGSGNLINN